jgi:hypothetical protein
MALYFKEWIFLEMQMTMYVHINILRTGSLKRLATLKTRMHIENPAKYH